jgi:hypothetical protein
MALIGFIICIDFATKMLDSSYSCVKSIALSPSLSRMADKNIFSIPTKSRNIVDNDLVTTAQCITELGKIY